MLKLKNISKSFNDKVIFKNFSFDFPENGIILINGASGIGKTTLLKIIAGLETADSGEIIKSGSIVLMFQEDRLLEWLNAGENISCVIKAKAPQRSARTTELLALVGLDGEQKKEIYQLSGGMKRRIAFARALATNPDILLLDEPFTGLDENSASVLTKLILDFSKEHLVVLVTHTVGEIEKIANSVISL